MARKLHPHYTNCSDTRAGLIYLILSLGEQPLTMTTKIMMNWCSSGNCQYRSVCPCTRESNIASPNVSLFSHPRKATLQAGGMPSVFLFWVSRIVTDSVQVYDRPQCRMQQDASEHAKREARSHHPGVRRIRAEHLLRRPSCQFASPLSQHRIVDVPYLIFSSRTSDHLNSRNWGKGREGQLILLVLLIVPRHLSAQFSENLLKDTSVTM